MTEMRSAAFVLLCLLHCSVALWRCVLLHGCAGVPTSLNSVATSFEASCERLLSGSTALLSDFDLASCLVVSGHSSTQTLCALIDRSSCLVEPSNLSHLKLVCSRSATLDLAIALLLRWNRASTCSGPSCGFYLASSGSSAPVFASVHPSRCSDRTPFREWNLLCCVAVFWHCISGHCISAGTSTFMYCCCGTSVICCTCRAGTVDVRHFWQLQLSLHFVDMIVSINCASDESRFSGISGVLICSVT